MWAEELTSGVATKGEESPLLIRATQEEQYPRLSLTITWIFVFKPPTSNGTRPDALSGHLVKDGFF